MKRLLCILLSLLLLASQLSACSQKMKEPVTFYYLQTAYQENMDSPVVGEEREGAGHRDDLKYLLSFYLMGPISKGLSSPLPRGTLLFAVSQEGGRLTIEISNTAALLTDPEFSLACACLSLTCMGLTDAEAVTITSGGRTLTMNPDNLALTDNTIPEESSK